MNRKFLVIIVILMLEFNVSCSYLNRVVYHIDINQGNYLTQDNIAKLHLGMTKKQVVYVLGTPIIQDPFGSNVLYYLLRQEVEYDSFIQKTLILNFDDSDILTNINYESVTNP